MMKQCGNKIKFDPDMDATDPLEEEHLTPVPEYQNQPIRVVDFAVRKPVQCNTAVLSRVSQPKRAVFT